MSSLMNNKFLNTLKNLRDPHGLVLFKYILMALFICLLSYFFFHSVNLAHMQKYIKISACLVNKTL